ncbi:MAG TPA: T9SS type A sorting domain-containing protein [Catalimonadaceae bacterium]|nr:T9SS type A sorting domain-containing protein [Catalimonadaceae bacterium]
MKKIFTLLLFVASFSARSQSVLTYKEVYDFQPEEVFGRMYNYYYPVVNPFDPFAPVFTAAAYWQVIDSVLTRNVIANGDSVQYGIFRTKKLGKIVASQFVDTATITSTLTLKYKYTNEPIVNTLPPPPSTGYMDTTYHILGSTIPVHVFRYHRHQLLDSSHIYTKGVGGPEIWANISQYTYRPQFFLIKKLGMPRLENPALISGNNAVDQAIPVSLWPNPAESKFHLDAVPANSLVFITDQLGKATFQTEYQPGTSFDVQSWKPGIYFIRITNQNKTIANLRFWKN